MTPITARCLREGHETFRPEWKTVSQKCIRRVRTYDSFWSRKFLKWLITCPSSLILIVHSRYLRLVITKLSMLP